MATKKKSMGKKTAEARARQVHFSVEPGTKVNITLEVGEQMVDGKVPLTVHIEEVGRDPIPGVEIARPGPMPAPKPVLTPARLWTGLETVRSRLQAYDLATWLFICAVAVYLLTRLIGLTKFPMYFFTDEAIQSLSMVDLIKNGYRDPGGVWFPTYFRNGDYYNIGLSVYFQWLPVILFGKSAVATRVTSILVTLIAAVSIGILLRDVFKLKYWWTGTLFLSITPAWFLHSRTAFETAEFVAFYTGTLCAYLLYRYRSRRYLYLTILLGAFAFYTYSPGQVIMPLTALGLLISDWRYHWEDRRGLLIGLALAFVLALPYGRSSINNPNAAAAHLHTLWSYWFEKIPLPAKIGRYLSEFGVGLSPWYWYIPNDRDLPRHLMKDYGNIMIATLPFALLGLAQALRNIRLSAYRTILIALLISPAAAALVQISITRTLVFVVPAAILTAIGLETVLGWIEDPKQRIAEIGESPGPRPWRVAAALLILVLGIFLASTFEKSINGLALWALTIILALQVSGVFERLAQSFTHRDTSVKPRLWRLPQYILALSAFLMLAGTNVRMLDDALRNGPLWFRDYGLGGMQYGAFQIFDIIEDYVKEHPEAKIIFSPDWTNGADVVARFMLDDFSAIQMGSVRGYIMQKLPLDEDTVFIMTPQEYDIIRESPKFSDIDVETIVPYPDGNPGFYFVHLRYVDNIE
jgi:4-amino-4-deoxy-L-arabinose transferase-like glycosyltransferase